MIQITEEQYLEASEKGWGFCLRCKKEASDVEPDGQGSRCKWCGGLKVYEADQVILMAQKFVKETQN